MPSSAVFRARVGSSSAISSALSMLRMPITQAATRLMLASKIVEADVDAVELAAANQLLGDGLQLVVQQHHVVAVPAHRPADVQQQPRTEHEHGAEIFSEITSVGWKWPASSVSSFCRDTA